MSDEAGVAVEVGHRKIEADLDSSPANSAAAPDPFADDDARSALDGLVPLMPAQQEVILQMDFEGQRRAQGLDCSLAFRSQQAVWAAVLS